MENDFTYEDAKTEIRMDDIHHDIWGTAISWHFSLCDYLNFETGETIPHHWQYSPSPIATGCEEDDECRVLLFRGMLDCDVLKFGELLHRVTRAANHAGKSY